MDTGVIIAIAVVAALIVVALVVALPRMRHKAEDRKLDQHRAQAAEHHRTQVEQRRHQAELAEAEAKRARAEADVNAKRAELHEHGLADHELGVGGTGTREVSGGRAQDPVQEGTERPHDTEFESGFEKGQRTDEDGSRRFARTEQHDVVAEPEGRRTT